MTTTSAPILRVSKRAADQLPIFMDWQPWLDGEAAQLGAAVGISTFAWSASGASITMLGSPAPSLVGSIARVWLSGGTPGGAPAILTCTITTTHGHMVARSIAVTVQP